MNHEINRRFRTTSLGPLASLPACCLFICLLPSLTFAAIDGQLDARLRNAPARAPADSPSTSAVHPSVESPAAENPATVPKGANAFLVMLDPGHGGRDRGATHGTLQESQIALRVALKLAALLKEDPRFEVAMTRDSDQTVSLEERTERAKKSGADLFLSIHLNSSSDSRAQGKEFYFQNQLPVDEESMFLASRENNAETPEPGTHEIHGQKHTTDAMSKRGDVRSIIDDLTRNERIFDSSRLSQILFETWSESSGKSRHTGSRAIRQAPFFVVANSHSPAVLVELGFITHPVEGPKLALANYQEELARSLYKGLTKFKESMDKERSGPLNSAHD